MGIVPRGQILAETTESSPRISEHMLRSTRARAARSPARHRKRGTANGDERALCRSTPRPTCFRLRKPATRMLEADRRISPARWAKPVAGVIVVSTALKRGSQRRLVSRAMSMGRSESRRSPYSRREHNPVSQPPAAAAIPMVPPRIGVAGANNQSFCYPVPAALVLPPLRIARPCSICNQSSFGRTTWPCRAIRVGLTTFLPISKIDRAGRPRSLPKHAPERRVI
jgi:hypothetical protein